MKINNICYFYSLSTVKKYFVYFPFKIITVCAVNQKISFFTRLIFNVVNSSF